DRTSVGLVTPVEKYKEMGKRPEELYMEALKSEPLIWQFLENATARGEVETTTDWSFVADRMTGENWFLAGECAGFADPILAAGLTLTHTGARDCAYTILELERGEHDAAWLKERYDSVQRKRVRQHMRFAEYWYSANGCFDDIRGFCSEIAKDAGLKMTPAAAFRWLSNGGLDDEVGQVVLGGFDVAGIKQLQWRLSEETVDYLINGKNTFKLNTKGAEETTVGVLREGKILRVKAYQRGARTLPLYGTHGLLVEAMKQSDDIEKIQMFLQQRIAAQLPPAQAAHAFTQCMQTLEVMAHDYWVLTSVKKGRPTLKLDTPKEGDRYYTSEDGKSKAPALPL
ncbi:MAG: hypothetical protein VYC34_05920, partial [Planctomycetota bacterium]|nr:hypothetical protein [Planctomycetota bacterium]